MSPKTPRECLLEEFNERKSRNPIYSLRAFARDIDCSIGFVSEVLADKRPLNVKAATKIADALEMTPLRRRIFVDSILARLPGAKSDASFQKDVIADDQFRLILDWYHFGILSLARVKNAKSESKWVARRMGISEAEAEIAVRRLTRLGLITTRDGKLVRTSSPITTTIDIPSYALKKSHQQTLEQTIDGLYKVPVTHREVSSTTVATTPEKIAEAKVMIRNFITKLSDYLEDGPKTEVYNVNFQLMPVTVIEG